MISNSKKIHLDGNWHEHCISTWRIPRQSLRYKSRSVLWEKRVLQQAVSGIVLFFLSASVASGATFYVRTDGNNANAGTANTAAGAWRTINWGAGHVLPGDVVRVQAGTYVEVASPGVSGAAGNTVTLVADGAVSTCGMSFSGRSYIRIIGFTMDRSLGGCANSPIVAFAGTNTGLEFWNDDVGNLNGEGYLVDHAGNGAVCNACIWLGGSVHNIGNPDRGWRCIWPATMISWAMSISRPFAISASVRRATVSDSSI